MIKDTLSYGFSTFFGLKRISSWVRSLLYIFSRRQQSVKDKNPITEYWAHLFLAAAEFDVRKPGPWLVNKLVGSSEIKYSSDVASASNYDVVSAISKDEETNTNQISHCRMLS